MESPSFIEPNEERRELVIILSIQQLFFDYLTRISSTVIDSVKITWKTLICFLDHLGTSYISFGSMASTFTVFYDENLHLKEDKEW